MTALLLLLNGPAYGVTIDSSEDWNDSTEDNGNITRTGSGSSSDPYTYVIPDGLTITSSGKMDFRRDEYFLIDLSGSNGGGYIENGGEICLRA